MRFRTTIAAAALLAAGATGAAAQQVNESRSTGPTGSVEVRTVAGRVRVVAWTRNQVQVTGQLGGGGERLVMEEEGGTVVVRVEVPGGRGGHVRDGKVRASRG